MSFIVVIGILAATFFGLSFITKRRFGSLGLALAGGSVLANLWTTEAARLVSSAGIQLIAPPTESVVAIILVVAPALILIVRGPIYRSPRIRLFGSALFALMAISLILDPLQMALVIDGSGRGVYDFLYKYRNVFITLGVMMAVVDVFFTKTSKTPRYLSKH